MNFANEEPDFIERWKNIYTDDLFKPVTGRKVYQIISICFSEFSGSFFLMILGCAVWLHVVPGVGIMVNPFVDLFNIALSWGLGYGSLYVCMAHVSGICLNPALTIALVLTGELSVYRMILYIIMQITGSLSGIIFLKTLAGSAIRGDYCLAKPPDNASNGMVFFYEFFGTFWLCILVLICYDKRIKSTFDFSPVKMGFSLVGLTIGLYRFTGCSLNPARSLASSIVAGEYEFLWLCLLGQLVGAILAPFWYLCVYNPQVVEPPKEEDAAAA